MSQQEATATPVTVKNNNHLSNYIREEDVQLCNSWLEVSVNPEEGAGKKRGDLWEAIKEHYDAACSGKSFYVERYGLDARWGTINRLVSKFLGHYLQAATLNASGSDAFDLVRFKVYVYENITLNLSFFKGC